MRGVTIRDRGVDNTLSLDLIDILNILGPRADNTFWLVEGAESTGPLSGVLHRLSDLGTKVTTARLREIASDVIQVIDGVFTGYSVEKSEPWIIIRAVDSSAYDVETDDNDILSKVQGSFNEVYPIPNCAEK